MRLRDVEPGDVEAYVRMRCDPAMMAELGGPMPRDGIEDKVRRDVEDAQAGTSWIRMILAENEASAEVAGSVVLWAHGTGDERVSEIGWMVLPEYQGRGLGKRAVRALLAEAREDGRWGTVHATPATTNASSNGICRSLGFAFIGERDTEFAGRVLRTNCWTIETSDATGDRRPAHGVRR